MRIDIEKSACADIPAFVIEESKGVARVEHLVVRDDISVMFLYFSLRHHHKRNIVFDI